MSSPIPHSDAAPRQPDAAAYELEQQAGFILRRVHQRASEIFNEVMGGHDLSTMQFSTLVKLHDLGEVSQNRLGRLIDMDPATTLGVVKRLKARGLVASRNDPDDGRRLLLTLSEEGLAKVSTMRAIAARVSENILAPLSQREQRTLLSLLKKIS